MVARLGNADTAKEVIVTRILHTCYLEVQLQVLKLVISTYQFTVAVDKCTLLSYHCGEVSNLYVPAHCCCRQVYVIVLSLW